MPVLLKANGPFDLEHTLESGQAFRWRRERGWHYGVVGGNVWKVRQASDGLELCSAPEPPEVTAPLARSYFRLDDDLRAVYRRIGREPRIARAIRRYRGLRLLRQEPWECLVSFIISAYSNIRRISGHVEELSQRYGDPVSLDGHLRHTFPPPPRLTELGEQDFRQLRLGYRSRYLARLPRTLLERALDLMELRAWPYHEARAALLEIDGVGEKVADCVLLFSLDKLEAFPVDVWVRRALTEWHFPGQKVTDRALRLWAAERFGGDAGYAQQYLFHGRRLQGIERKQRAPQAEK